MATKACQEPLPPKSTPMCTRHGLQGLVCGPEEAGVTLANAFGKGLVDDAFSRHPAPQHIAVIKHACEGLLIPLDGLFGQSGVVSQHKMDVLGVDLALVCLF